ncbi:hypothetical protein C8F01DRAFT_1265669 [Mycena amicta]|nr:hypothetical protein C8F01DRAFT_1265669 [Mycena amicta]
MYYDLYAAATISLDAFVLSYMPRLRYLTERRPPWLRRTGKPQYCGIAVRMKAPESGILSLELGWPTSAQFPSPLPRRPSHHSELSSSSSPAPSSIPPFHRKPMLFLHLRVYRRVCIYWQSQRGLRLCANSNIDDLPACRGVYCCRDFCAALLRWSIKAGDGDDAPVVPGMHIHPIRPSPLQPRP